MKYNKLVRDKIPEIIIKKGSQPITHIANNQEYWLKLKEKLIEEVNEYIDSEEIEELADIQEVINAIYNFKNINPNNIEKIRKEKMDTRGAFQKKIILDES